MDYYHPRDQQLARNCRLIGIFCQELGQFTYLDAIESTLHWTQQMMLEMRNLNCLIDHQHIDLTSLWMIISNTSTDCAVLLASIFLVITVDTNWSPIIMNDQSFLSNN